MKNNIKLMLNLHIKNDLSLLPKNQRKVLRYINKLELKNKKLGKCLEEIDLIFYRLRFIDFNKIESELEYLYTKINYVRLICQLEDMRLVNKDIKRKGSE